MDFMYGLTAVLLTKKKQAESINLLLSCLNVLQRKLFHLVTLLDQKARVLRVMVEAHYLVCCFRDSPSILINGDHTTLAEWPDVLFHEHFNLRTLKEKHV
jgi:hypothetical protein